MAAWLTQGLEQGQKPGSLASILASQCFFCCFSTDQPVPEAQPAPDTRTAAPVKHQLQINVSVCQGFIGSTLTQSWGQDPPLPWWRWAAIYAQGYYQTWELPSRQERRLNIPPLTAPCLLAAFSEHPRRKKPKCLFLKTQLCFLPSSRCHDVYISLLKLFSGKMEQHGGCPVGPRPPQVSPLLHREQLQEPHLLAHQSSSAELLHSVCAQKTALPSNGLRFFSRVGTPFSSHRKSPCPPRLVGPWAWYSLGRVCPHCSA